MTAKMVGGDKQKSPLQRGFFRVVPARCSTLKQELYYAIQNLLAKG